MKKVSLTLIFLIVFIIVVLAHFGLIQHSRDYSDYLYSYNNIENTRFEFLYKLINIIGKNYLYFDFPLFVTLLSVVTMGMKMYLGSFLSNSRIKFLIFFIGYVFSFYLLHELTQYRVSLGLFFVSISTLFLIKKRVYYSTLCVLLGALCHSSMFVFLLIPIAIVLIKKIDIKWIFIIGLTLCFSSLLVMPFVMSNILIYKPDATGYVENWHNYHVSYIGIGPTLSYLTCIFFLFVVKNEYSYKQLIVFLYFFVALCTAIFFVPIPEIAIRFFDIAAVLSMYLFLIVDFKLKLSNIFFHLMVILTVLFRIIAFNFYFPLF